MSAFPKATRLWGPSWFPSSSSFLSFLLYQSMWASKYPSMSVTPLRDMWRERRDVLFLICFANICVLVGPSSRPVQVSSKGVLLKMSWLSMITIRPSSLFIDSSSCYCLAFLSRSAFSLLAFSACSLFSLSLFVFSSFSLSCLSSSAFYLRISSSSALCFMIFSVRSLSGKISAILFQFNSCFFGWSSSAIMKWLQLNYKL